MIEISFFSQRMDVLDAVSLIDLSLFARFLIAGRKLSCLLTRQKTFAHRYTSHIYTHCLLKVIVNLLY